MNALTLQVLRRVEGLNPVVQQELVDHEQLFEYEDGSTWIINDSPHDYVVTNEIIRATKGYAVADEYGRILAGPFRDLGKAEAAKNGAKVEFGVEVEVDEETDLDEDDEV